MKPLRMRALSLTLFVSLWGSACGGAPSPEAPPGEPVAPRLEEPSPFDEPRKATRGPRKLPEGQADSPRLALGTQGAVASQEAHATDVGLDVLRRGGNAVDAAVAVGFALAVTHPTAGNLGGGGFLVLRTPTGETAALDFREMAPSAASRDMYLGKDGKPTKESLEGPKAAGIPGSVAGLAAAHARYGKLPWKQLVAPAIELAAQGFELDEVGAADLARGVERMSALGFGYAAKVYGKADGKPLAKGERLVQPDLAETLRAIADDPKSFYTGPLAERMAKEVKKAGGIWVAEDLRRYEPKWRTPIVFAYRGREVITMPPPSAGGVVLRQLLAASEAMKLESKPWRSADEIHLFAEAMRRTYADRNLLLGDPDHVAIPLEHLLDTTYVKGRLADVDPARATPSTKIGAGEAGKQESMQTTHYSVVDAEGMAVATTTTLNTGYGSKYAVPGTGVLLNNEMDDFSVKPGSPNVFGLVQGEPNAIAPGKRMLSSMTPTILVENGELRAVLGSPGGPTISTTVAQVVRGLVDYGRPIDEAVEALRAHHQWLPDQIWTEEKMPAELEQALVAKGHTIKKRPRIGHANCIEVDPETRGFRAVADTTRAGGKAAAY